MGKIYIRKQIVNTGLLLLLPVRACVRACVCGKHRFGFWSRYPGIGRNTKGKHRLQHNKQTNNTRQTATQNYENSFYGSLSTSTTPYNAFLGHTRPLADTESVMFEYVLGVCIWCTDCVMFAILSVLSPLSGPGNPTPLHTGRITEDGVQITPRWPLLDFKMILRHGVGVEPFVNMPVRH